MSIATLKGDAKRLHVSTEYRSYITGRRRDKRAGQLREDVLARLLGPRFPGFSGDSMAQVDQHITLLADCYTGGHGKALQLALHAYWSFACAHEKLHKLLQKKRLYPAEQAALEEEAARSLSLLKAATIWYELACTLRGNRKLDVIPPLPESAAKPLSYLVPVPQQPVAPVSCESPETQIQRLDGLRAAIAKARTHLCKLPPVGPTLVVLGVAHEPAENRYTSDVALLEQALEAISASPILGAVRV